MNKLVISAGAALSAASLLLAAPARAGTLTFNYDVDSTLEVTFNPLFAGNTFSGITVPNSLTVTADDVAGSFTVLDDTAQFTDGSLEFDYSLIDEAIVGGDAILETLLGDYGLAAGQLLESADSLFNISQFQGGGILTSKDFSLPGNPSPFNISYSNTSNTVVIDGYDTDVAESCLSTTCLLDGNISYSVNLVLSEFVSLTSDLLTSTEITLSQEDSAAIANLQQIATLAQIFGPTLSLGTVAVNNFAATTDFVSADPAGTALDATVPDGVITATTTTGTEQEQLFSASLAPELPPAESAVVDAESETIPPAALEEDAVPAIASLPAITKPAVTVFQEPVIVASLEADAIAAPAAAGAISSGDDAQAVPEPSILLGLLGSAALLKRGRKKTAAQ